MLRSMVCFNQLNSLGICDTEEVVEREKWHQAAEFHQTVVSDCNFGKGKCSDVIDVGYNGCLLERSLNFTAGVLNASQPELGDSTRALNIFKTLQLSAARRGLLFVTTVRN